MAMRGLAAKTAHFNDYAVDEVSVRDRSRIMLSWLQRIRFRLPPELAFLAPRWAAS